MPLPPAIVDLSLDAWKALQPPAVAAPAPPSC